MTDISGNLGIHAHNYDRKDTDKKIKPECQIPSAEEEAPKDATNLNAAPNAVYGEALVNNKKPYSFDSKKVEKDVLDFKEDTEYEINLYKELVGAMESDLIKKGYTPEEAKTLSRELVIQIFNGSLKVR